MAYIVFHTRFLVPPELVIVCGDALGLSSESSMLADEKMARLEGLGGGEEVTLAMGLADMGDRELSFGVDTKEGGLVEGGTGSSVSMSCGVRPKLVPGVRPKVVPGVCTMSRMSTMSWELAFRCCRSGSRLS